MLLQLKEKKLTLGIGQSYDVIFGSKDFREREDRIPIEGKIIYSDRNKRYSDDIFIDFANYPTICSVSTGEEDVHDAIIQMSKSADIISYELKKMNQKLNLPKESENENSLFDYLTSNQ